MKMKANVREIVRGMRIAWNYLLSSPEVFDFNYNERFSDTWLTVG